MRFLATLLLIGAVGFSCVSLGQCPQTVVVKSDITAQIDDISQDNRFVCTPGPCPALFLNTGNIWPLYKGTYTRGSCFGGGAVYGQCGVNNSYFSLGQNSECPQQN